jgi:DNA-binding transcriptional MerR regulator/methylmalonyl-CoA mutase cobalamin-binding subunit
MTNFSSSPRHSIADVERDTGLSKDTLRVWERRYGFPKPERDALGERQYDEAQLLRLRHVRRLLDAGHRPAQVVALPLDALVQLPPAAGRRSGTPADVPKRKSRPTAAEAPPLDQLPQPSNEHAHWLTWMEMLRQHDASGLRAAMEQHARTHGLLALMRDGIAPLNVQVGQAWLDGQLAVFEEHLYTETVQSVLRHAMGQLSAAKPHQPPRLLLTTVPGEPHALGLLMAECAMVLEGCDTVNLGVQTPVPDIVAACRAYRADVVALSFSALQNPRDVRAVLTRLRELLPASVALWAGGQCPVLHQPVRGLRRNQAPAFRPMARLEDIGLAVAQWRESHRRPAPELCRAS